MNEINLEEFETSLVVRPLRMEDFEALVALQRRCFAGMEAWSREQLQSQLERFQDGQIGVEVEGELVASCSSLIVDSSRYAESWHKWEEVADGGWIRNHDPDGDTLYGIEIMVHPGHRGKRLSRRLYDERKRICRERNLARIIIGGRLPGYHRYAKDMSAREYVEAVMRKQIHDPVLTAQLANDFVLKRLIPNYLREDKESLGYATFLEWVNLDYVPPRPREIQTVSTVRLGLVQYQQRRIGSFDEFATQCEFFVDVAAEHRSDFVVFPELLTVQLLSFIDAKRPGEAVRKLAELTPQYLELFGELAIKYNVNIVGGSQFTLEGDHLHNTAYLFRRDGSIDRQHKLHITPSERKWWGVEPGDALEVFDTDRGKVAILVEYDIQFPELARLARALGADILFVPFDTGEISAFQRVRTCARARAIENELYVAIAGSVGNLPFVDNADVHYAQSGLFTPIDFAFNRDGVAVEASANAETVLIHDVDLEALRRHRFGGTVQNWRDRRRDLYAVRGAGGGVV